MYLIILVANPPEKNNYLHFIIISTEVYDSKHIYNNT